MPIHPIKLCVCVCVGRVGRRRWFARSGARFTPGTTARGYLFFIIILFSHLVPVTNTEEAAAAATTTQ